MPQARASRVGSSRWFPPPELAGKDGLIAVGGNLLPETLIDAYRHGIFPWPTGQVLAWWSPDPRAVIEFDRLHISQRLRRTLRSHKFQVTCDRDFPAVIEGCATAQQRERGTWITPELRFAYEKMHQLGYAHSVEAWVGPRLAGGIYGLSLGGMFAAESMFYDERDGSKVALVHLVRHLQARGYLLLDIQQLTPHTTRMGASEIPRAEFLQRLKNAISRPVTFGRALSTAEIAW